MTTTTTDPLEIVSARKSAERTAVGDLDLAARALNEACLAATEAGFTVEQVTVAIGEPERDVRYRIDLADRVRRGAAIGMRAVRSAAGEVSP